MGRDRLQTLALVGMLAGLSFVTMLLIEIPLFVEWLKYDPSDVVALIGGFTLGPVPGMLVVVLRNVLKGLVKLDPVGLAMNTVAGVTYVFVATSYYLPRLTKKDAAWGLVLGGSAQVLVCIPAATVGMYAYNQMMGFPKVDQIPSLLVTVILPFNVVKVGLNGVLTFFLYKRIASHLPRLRGRAGVGKPSRPSLSPPRTKAAG